MKKKNPRIVEVRCKECNELLLRGTQHDETRKVSRIELTPRKMAKITNISSGTKLEFPGRYDEHDGVTIVTEFEIDATCRKCGTPHHRMVSNYFFEVV